MRRLTNSFLALLLAGCSQLPVCEKFSANAVVAEDNNTYVVMDIDNVRILQKMIKGLSERTCILENYK